MQKLDRRQFIYCGAAFLGSLTPCYAFWRFGGGFPQTVPDDIRGHVFSGGAPQKPWKWSHEGFAYKKLGKDKVVCGICPHHCVLHPGDRSVCRSKVNIDGVLYSLAYGNPCAVHIDPIEKKPLYHFLPRTTAFSIAAAGCNLRCLNCQNWEISQFKPEDVRHVDLFPSAVVKRAQSSRARSIAYTYSEPVTFFEYMFDTARLARRQGIYNLLISAGYINRRPLKALCRVLDAANINLKSFSDAIYRRLNGARLKPVLDTFETLQEQGVHFEMTNLVVPGYVDDADMVRRMCTWIVAHLGPDRPLHFLRFFPRYKLDRLPPTPVSTLTRFREIAMQTGIRYVYVGNVPGHPGNHTYCHHCKKMLIERQGFRVPTYNLVGSRCRFCNTVIPGVWGEKG